MQSDKAHGILLGRETWHRLSSEYLARHSLRSSGNSRVRQARARQAGGRTSWRIPIQNVFWPEFQALDAALVSYLQDITQRLIREEVHRETGDAEEVHEAGQIEG
jgi:hypothetical protein